MIEVGENRCEESNKNEIGWLLEQDGEVKPSGEYGCLVYSCRCCL